MNIINKVTIRHLKENKRRSLVTIIGVIISVAMITAVITLGISFLDLMIRQDIAKNGEWHVQYRNVTAEQIKAIEDDSETKTTVLSKNSYATFEESSNIYKPYFYFQQYNKTGMEQFPIQISEGRLPENENEVAISETVLNDAEAPYEIGNELTLNLGTRRNTLSDAPLTQNDPLAFDEDETLMEELEISETKTVTVVGTIKQPNWEYSWSPGYTIIGYVDETSLAENKTVHALVALSKVNGKIYEHAKNLAEENGIETVSYNTELLRYYGVTKNDQLRTTLYSLTTIILSVIIIGSVALIYNAFAISVSERARHLGMLSSVGATKKQKRNSVFFEGAVIGAISIPFGILAGLLGMGITFSFINTFIQDALNVSEKLTLVVSPASILIASGVSILTIFISTYLPAQKASKISAIDAIRQTQDIKLIGKTVKTSKLVRKIFGLEAEIGLKNVKRNKKRYVATVFSLVISIVLFLSVTFFTDNLKKSLEMSQNNLDFDIQVYSSSNKLDYADLTQFRNLPYVTKSSIVEETNFQALISVEELPEPLKNQVSQDSTMLEDGKYVYYVMLYALDNKSFQEYAKQIGINPEDISSQGSTRKGIVIDEITYEDAASGKFIETQSMVTEVGNSIELFNYDYENMENGEAKKVPVSSVEISALTNEVPMGIQSATLGGVNVIVSKETFEELALQTESTAAQVYINSSDPTATQAAIEELKDPNISIFNVDQQRQQEEQMILLMSVFTYGFITLISLISIANIFNTISTSISLRKREFAMLRSVGMTPKGFNKMVRYESIFYGLKALLYGLPISAVVMYGIHHSIDFTFQYEFTLPWMSILFVIVMIFFIVGSAMLYSVSKIKNENIIESLKQENI